MTIFQPMQDTSIIRVLILGSTGMLGHTLVSYLRSQPHIHVFTASRSNQNSADPNAFTFDAKFPLSISKYLQTCKPDVVINCIGIIKQMPAANDPIECISTNSILPHVIAMECEKVGARFIHISTDCVFSGKKGNYYESDNPDATDLYGRSKLMGEVYDKGALTLRTSIIGHEINSKHSLLEWFLSQSESAQGFTKAIFSGLTTLELSKVIVQNVIPRKALTGLYHVSSEPINKYDLLNLIKSVYQKNISIIPNNSVAIDRSLNSSSFQQAFHYKPTSWESQIDDLYRFNNRTNND